MPSVVSILAVLAVLAATSSGRPQMGGGQGRFLAGLRREISGNYREIVVK